MGFGPSVSRLRIAVVDEHQVEVRAVAQFDAADLAIADDDEIRVAVAAVAALGRAVPGHRVPPGQRQHLIEDRLGQPGQVVADLHQRQRAGELRGGHAQAVRQLEVAQRLHLLFQIVLGNPRQPLAQFGGQLRRLGRAVQAAFIEQFVEQQREMGDLLGDQRAGRAELQQAGQRAGVLGEQHQIRRAPGHRLRPAA